MSIKDWDAKRFGEKYSRALYNSTRKTAYAIGKDVIDIYRDDALAETLPMRRKKAVFKVRKNNTLVFIDSGFDARVREYGATINAPAGGYLTLPFDGAGFRKMKRGNFDFARDTFVLSRPGKAPLVVEKGGKPIAVLKKRVVRKPIMEGDRLSNVAQVQSKNFEAFFYDNMNKETQ